MDFRVTSEAKMRAKRASELHLHFSKKYSMYSIVISFFKCFERWRVGGVSGWYVGVVSWRCVVEVCRGCVSGKCVGVGRGGGWSG